MLNEALRLIRVFHDKKSNELAKELNISAAYLSEIENGKKQPSFDLINKYAEVFHTKSSVILFFSEDLERDNANGLSKDSIRKNLLKFMKALERCSDGNNPSAIL